MKVYNDKRSHWITSEPLDKSVEWDADIVEARENELISWTSVKDADIANSGSVRFKPALNDRGTEVKVVTGYNPSGGTIGDAIAKLFGEGHD
ncbi:SRPBCC family protein [Nostoc sp.]|uniref:SRPBCC family protein n=1 Tax=Nostoc sp. TaxID=1180 RepID=UPI002FFA7150